MRNRVFFQCIGLLLVFACGLVAHRIQQEDIYRARLTRVRHWLGVEDGATARVAFEKGKSQDEALMEKITYDYFHELNPEVQQLIIEDLELFAAERSERALHIIKQAALECENGAIQASAIAKIIDISHTRELWTLLDHLLSQETSVEVRRQMAQKLALNIRRVEPEQARAYLMDLMFVEEPTLRRLAVSELVARSDLDAELSSSLRCMLAIYPDDLQVVHEILKKHHVSADLLA